MGSTTVVLVPRESFSTVRRGLRSVARAAPPETPVVLVDGGSPRRVQRELERAAQSNGYLLLRSEHLLSPNRARNLARGFVHTEFVLFVDYETEMPAGTIEQLEQCARETGADIVGPVYLEGTIGSPRQVHMAGGACHFVGPAEARHFIDRHHKRDHASVAATEPMRTEQVEFHCLLIRTQVLDRVGGLDEQLLSLREHSDVCLAVRELGGEVWFEPRAPVYYSRPRFPTLADIEYCLVRWSDTWNRSSVDHFDAKWSVAADDPAAPFVLNFGRTHRWYTYRPYLSLVSRCFGSRRRAFYAWVDRHAQRWAERRNPLEASVSADLEVVHAPAWASVPGTHA